MSVVLDKLQDQMLEVADPVAATSVVYSAHVLPTGLGGVQVVFGQTKAGVTSTDYNRLYLDDFTVKGRNQRGFSSSAIATGPDLVESQWQHILMRNDKLLPPHDLQVAAADVYGAVMPNSVVPFSIAQLNIGGFKPGSNASLTFGGHIAEVAVYGIKGSGPWPEPMLSLEERTLLAMGARPDTVAVDRLIAYWSLFTNGNDVVGTRHLTAVNGATYVPGVHPVMFDARTILNYERGLPGVARGMNRGMAA